MPVVDLVARHAPCQRRVAVYPRCLNAGSFASNQYVPFPRGCFVSSFPILGVTGHRVALPEEHIDTVVANLAHPDFGGDVIQKQDFSGFSIAHCTLNREHCRASLITDRMMRLPVSRQARSDGAIDSLDFSIPQGSALERSGRQQQRATLQPVDGTDIMLLSIPPSAMSLSKRRRLTVCVTSKYSPYLLHPDPAPQDQHQPDDTVRSRTLHAQARHSGLFFFSGRFHELTCESLAHPHKQTYLA